ncbi:ABC transporter ATP-binding protein [Olleya sp. Bg11-27]|uniref:ABC transporter ATP-binding protein n=1 Tax=Olleya sp. Bg11-27 TaxID=2058135 RepID=UPI000C316E74|nr:ABC transporter ATP-binding protein [Olleya sp. Bg11-27]AUC75809.1 ABC transporter ATP-binding protein [Olleya sp. Bg11-27]
MTDKDIILKASNISKQYRLGVVGTGTIADDLKRWWYRVRGKEDPFLKIGESNDRSTKGLSDYVWALQDINFEVKRGEVLGIIGKNGAGKSTLLKILSKVTGPTTGEIKTRGRIASLLEVGTGFHGEMTGRENVYLNGAILGMTKKEINAKIEEIIEFSGCERYIDTPVKRYSSGMTVRLAFAVAAFLEPEILVVDEVLAVGDDEFQKKAIGKMQEISKGEGRTVLFVSHNMAAIQDLCTRVLLMSNGVISLDGSVEEVVNTYLSAHSSSIGEVFFDYDKSHEAAKIKSIKVYNNQDEVSAQLKSGEHFKFVIDFDVKRELRNPVFSLRISDLQNVNIVTWRSNDFIDSPLKTKINNDFNVVLEIDSIYLLNGIYDVSMGFADGKEVLDMRIKQFQIEILPSKPDERYHILTKEKSSNSLIFSSAKWNVNV